MSEEKIVVLYGGVGSEREVSIRSGLAVLDSLRKKYPDAIGFELLDRTLPEFLQADTHIVFPVLHGEFGEDGALQTILEEKGFSFVGCDSKASKLCIHKGNTKEAINDLAVKQPADRIYQDGDCWKIVSSQLGDAVIAKPLTEGSSQGLFFIKTEEEWTAFTESVDGRTFILEQFISGVDVTVGVLEGKALGVVKILPQGGLYDYERKYAVNQTEYEFPAQLPDELTAFLRESSERVYQRCGVRDFCRVDYRIDEQGTPYFLEVNTIPGMTETSLFPKSATCLNYDFDSLCLSMLQGALQRFHSK